MIKKYSRKRCFCSSENCEMIHVCRDSIYQTSNREFFSSIPCSIVISAKTDTVKHSVRSLRDVSRMQKHAKWAKYDNTLSFVCYLSLLSHRLSAFMGLFLKRT